MRLHTVIVSYNRRDLLQRTVESYLATVTVPYSLMIVDNGSAHTTVDYLRDLKTEGVHIMELGRNRWPGPACNIGFGVAPPQSKHLHRSDSDMEYLPGWCEEVQERFADETVGQVGLRTDEEENHTELNVGGTAIFRRELWDAGLRYREDSWRVLGTMTEDYWISVAVTEMGWRWTRVQRPCVIHTATGDLTDPYYRRSYGVRGIA